MAICRTPFTHLNMAQVKARRNQQPISKSRAANASLLTFLTLVVFAAVCYHAFWVLRTLLTEQQISYLRMAAVVGSLILNIVVSVKLLQFLDSFLLNSKIDADHKKYI